MVEPRGSSGGLVLFFNDEIKLDIIALNSRSDRYKSFFNGNKVFISFFYGNPVVKFREKVWETLTRIDIQRLEPWLMIGNFNKLTGNHEKGGAHAIGCILCTL